MSKKTLIAVEGNTGVGKTTLYEYLASNGYSTIEEYSFTLPKTKYGKFPDFPPLTIDNLIKSHSVWKEIEEIRSANLDVSKSKYVVDRSFITLFAFEYAKKQLGYLYEVKKLSQMLLELLAGNQLIVPTHIVHIIRSYDTIIKIREGYVNPFLYNLDVMQSVDYLTELFGKKLVGENYMKIDNNGNGIENIGEKVLEQINLSSSSDSIANVKELLKELGEL